MGGKAPSSAKIEAVLEDARVDRVVRDDRWKARGIKEELGEELWFFNGYLLNEGEEGGPADHEGGPEVNHVGTGGSKGWAEQKDVMEVAHFTMTAWQSA